MYIICFVVGNMKQIFMNVKHVLMHRHCNGQLLTVKLNVINQPWKNINLYVHRLLLSAARHWNLWEYFLFRVFYSWSDQKPQYYRRLGLRLAVLTSSFHIPFKCKQTRVWYWVRVRRYKCVIYFTRWICLIVQEEVFWNYDKGFNFYNTWTKPPSIWPTSIAGFKLFPTSYTMSVFKIWRIYIH